MSMMQFYWDLSKKIRGDDNDFSSASSYEDKIDSDYYRYLYSLQNSLGAYNPETNYYYQANKGMAKTSSGSGGSYAPYIAAGGQALGALASIYNTYEQAEMAEAQLQLLKENNELSYRMFKEGNMFNAEEAEKAFQRSYDASKYTTQSALMRAAGLNPQLMFGEGNLLHPAQSSAASAEGVPSFQSPVGVQPPQLSFDGLNQLASAMKSIAEAKKLGVDTDYLEQSLKYRLASDEANSRYQKVLADLQEKYGDEKSSAELRKIDKEIKYMTEQIDLMIKQEGLVDEQTLTQMYDTYIRKCEYLEKERLFNAKDALQDYWKDFVIGELSLLQNQGLLAGVQAKWLPRQVMAQETSSYASLVGAYSQSEVNRAVADLTDKQKELLKFEIDKVKKDAGLAKIIDDMNDNEIVQFLIQSKYLVNQIPILGNILEGLSGQGGKEIAKKVITKH